MHLRQAKSVRYFIPICQCASHPFVVFYLEPGPRATMAMALTEGMLTKIGTKRREKVINKLVKK